MKENISLPKAFIAQQDESKEWIEEEETSEDKGLNVKGLMTLINDVTYSKSRRCDADTHQAVKESKTKRWNVSSTRQVQ